ncbi:7347_t:CDS:1 [Paraglomus brasilianum]|uniref:7347_t:CDS:1 n=1 Tax=Paraglomus brasilianum TaxID=144538 RepID=A0A9N9FFB5_9GLOM|nr:7347_t:CDS:1 [Paraglomus brasilianum]
MRTQYFVFFSLVILFNLAPLVFSCQVGDEYDYECYLGYVCSSAPSTYGQCIYGCHHDSDCQFDTTDTQNQKCDTSLTTWSCTCGNYTVCPGDGQCYEGHCILGSFTDVATCDHPTLKVYFDGICKWAVKKAALLNNPTVKIVAESCALAAWFYLPARLVGIACGAIASYIVAASTGTNYAAEETCANAWSSVCGFL